MNSRFALLSGMGIYATCAAKSCITEMRPAGSFFLLLDRSVIRLPDRKLSLTSRLAATGVAVGFTSSQAWWPNELISKKELLLLRLNGLQREILHICGQAVAPVFRVPAIRDYAMRRAVVAAGVWDEDYPALEPKHLDNPRLFANREDLISSMRFAEGGVIAEIGVATGEFSEYLLNQLQPKKFVAFDIFNLHEWDTFLRIPTKTLFNNMTHLDYYNQRFADRGAQMVIEVGRSNLNLAKYPDKSFDLIYVDADHSYEGVKQDADVAKAKLADNGVIVFNDYTCFDFLMGVRYGVIRAVNELIIKDDWRVCGFALNRTMYCDIAIHKQSGYSP